ncbi:MAG: Universal stress protein [Methanomassiliicoccales archaeon PtaU1.Bin124]|nr:MAG: Universal stress protein [Methanomassiliicoccales archaeon PtaU1.Bin124]
MLFDKVLVPVDLSEVSANQVSCVSKFHDYGMKEAIILFVSGDDVTVDQREKLDSLAQQCSTEASGARVLIEKGKPSATILKVAKREKATMLVMASSGKTKAKELMVGSVSLDVVRNAKVPVLVGKFATDRPTCPMLMDSVLVSLDLGPCTKGIMNVFKEMDTCGCKKAVLFHVVPSNKFSVEDDRKFQDVKKDLGKWKDSHDGICSIDTHLHYGTAAYNIMEAAREFNSTLIVMGNVGKGLFHSMTLGSVSDEVLRKGNVHVLIVPV